MYPSTFINENDPTGRSVANFDLIREGYPPINVKFIDRRAYCDTFDVYSQDGNATPMADFSATICRSGLSSTLAYLGIRRYLYEVIPNSYFTTISPIRRYIAYSHQTMVRICDSKVIETNNTARHPKQRQASSGSLAIHGHLHTGKA